MAIGTREESILHQTNIVTEELMAASRLLTAITGNEVQPNKAIVGKNAFAHEAGIHQHGVLNNPMTYEIMTPESVGLTSNNIVLGKHSGRFALSKRLESIGYKLEKNELNKVYHKFTDLADEQKTINDDDLHSLVSTTLPHRKVSGDTTVTQR